ncbi:MAG: hypothetical protein RL042_241 [Nitrospirota bacterium]
MKNEGGLSHRTVCPLDQEQSADYNHLALTEKRLMDLAGAWYRENYVQDRFYEDASLGPRGLQ